jgi:hypothetical protein
LAAPPPRRRGAGSPPVHTRVLVAAIGR